VNKNLKKGITTSVLLVALVIMSILIGSATIVGTNAIKTANYEDFKSEMSRIKDMVNDYSVKNDVLPVKNEIVATSTMPDTLRNEISKNGDLNENFYVIDMNKINDSTISIGRGDVSNSDVFLVTDSTQNIYYLKGYTYKSKIYYGM